MLVIGSQPTPNSILSHNNNDGYNNNQELASINYDSINYSADAALSGLSTIYRATIFDSTAYQNVSNNNLQDNVNNNDYGNSNNSNYQPVVLTSSIEPFIDYPNGELGKVAVVLVPDGVATSYSNNEIEMNQAPSTDDADAYSSSSLSSSSPPFGLNKTSAFIIDYGNSTGSSSASPSPPKVIMLDVQTGNITPFLTLNGPDSNFVPIDVAFDYNNSALYVLSIGNNQEKVEEGATTITNNASNNLLNTDKRYNNSDIIWKVNYKAEGQKLEASREGSSISNDNSDNNIT